MLSIAWMSSSCTTHLIMSDWNRACSGVRPVRMEWGYGMGVWNGNVEGGMEWGVEGGMEWRHVRA